MIQYRCPKMPSSDAAVRLDASLSGLCRQDRSQRQLDGSQAELHSASSHASPSVSAAPMYPQTSQSSSHRFSCRRTPPAAGTPQPRGLDASRRPGRGDRDPALRPPWVDGFRAVQHRLSGWPQALKIPQGRERSAAPLTPAAPVLDERRRRPGGPSDRESPRSRCQRERETGPTGRGAAHPHFRPPSGGPSIPARPPNAKEPPAKPEVLKGCKVYVDVFVSASLAAGEREPTEAETN